MNQTPQMEEKLRDLLTAIGVQPPAPDVELNLKSLQVVTLVDQIERTFELHLTGRDVTRRNFRTINAICALLAAKGAAVAAPVSAPEDAPNDGPPPAREACT